MLSKIFYIYSFSVIGSTSYIFYKDFYYHYYLHEGKYYITPSNFINVGMLIGAITGYNIYKLLN